MLNLFKVAEINERKYLNIIITKFNVYDYEISPEGSFKRWDMIGYINGIQYIFEIKCRKDVKPYYEEQGMMMEIEKYESLKLIGMPILYINILDDNRGYIFKVDKIIAEYTDELTTGINYLRRYIDCPKAECDQNKGRKKKAVLLLPTTSIHTRKFYI